MRSVLVAGLSPVLRVDAISRFPPVKRITKGEGLTTIRILRGERRRGVLLSFKGTFDMDKIRRWYVEIVRWTI